MAPARSGSRRAEPAEVHAISQAQDAHSLGVDSRMKRYALKMALRVVCIVIAVFTHGWVMWAAIAGAAILPWVAVVLANGTDRAEVRNVDYLLHAPRPELRSAPHETAAGRRAREAAAGFPRERAEDSPKDAGGTADGTTGATSSDRAHDEGAEDRSAASAEIIDGEVVDSRREAR